MPYQKGFLSMSKSWKVGYLSLLLVVATGCTVSGNVSTSTTPSSSTPAPVAAQSSATPASAATPASSATPAASGSPAAVETDMKVVDFKFLASKDGEEIYTTTFAPGQDIFFSCTVEGFKIAEGGEAWLQGDLQLLNANDEVLVSKENIADVHGNIPEGNDATASLSQNIEITKDTTPGDYKLNLIFRDKMSGAQVSKTENITVEAP